MRTLAIALCLPAALPANAGEDALSWLTDRLEFPHAINPVGTWQLPDGTLIPADPLTLLGSEQPIKGLPTGPARVFGIQEQFDSGRTAAMALIWSDAAVVCGDDITTIGVDTGLAAFMLPSDVAALERYGKTYQGNLYNGPYATQIDTQYPGPFFVDLPDTSQFPLSGSGWGDGGYPVATLKDASGSITALYVQFITEGEEWLLPPACGKPSS